MVRVLNLLWTNSLPRPSRLFFSQMFRLEAVPQEVLNISNVATGSLDHLGVDFFSKMFLGLWHDAYGNEVRLRAYPPNVDNPNQKWLILFQVILN